VPLDPKGAKCDPGGFASDCIATIGTTARQCAAFRLPTAPFLTAGVAGIEALKRIVAAIQDRGCGSMLPLLSTLENLRATAPGLWVVAPLHRVENLPACLMFGSCCDGKVLLLETFLPIDYPRRHLSVLWDDFINMVYQSSESILETEP